MYEKRMISAIAFFLFTTILAFGENDKPLILRTPTLSRTQVGFACAGDLWIVAREGGEAKRLTASVGMETNPVFSPTGA